MADRRPLPLSLLTLLALAGIITLIRWLNPPLNVLSWDVLGYYLYLPAVFIYNDLGLKDLAIYQNLIEQYQASSTLYQVITLPDGTNLFRYSMGMAVLYFPFFLIGHLFALISPYAADGFSLPYQWALSMGGLLYTYLGLWFLRKVLKEFFSEKITAISLALIVLGTNYLEIASIDGLLTHNFLFSLYALVLWFTIRWHKKPEIGNSVALGLLLGISALSRPNEMLLVLIPLFWNVYNKESFLEKLRFFSLHWKKLVLIIVCFILAGLPQVIYWKYFTGQFLFYSYGNPGEGFEFLWPYTLKSLFSFRKGWLLYTPIMLFAIAGLFLMARKRSPVFLAFFLFLILNLWVVTSWSCWHYANSFSQRALVQSYPVLAISLAYAIRWIIDQKNLLRLGLFFIILLLVALNLFQTWQFTNGILDGNRMTGPYYCKIFGKASVSEEDRKLLLIQRSTETYEKMPEDLSAFRHTVIGSNGFENPEEKYKDQYVTTPVHSGNYALRLDSNYVFSPDVRMAYKDITSGYYAWIRASVWVYPIPDQSTDPFHLVITFQYKGMNYKYRTLGPSQDFVHLVPGEWNKLEIDYMSPEVRTTDDELLVYLWLQGKQSVYFDDLKVETFVPID